MLRWFSILLLSFLSTACVKKPALGPAILSRATNATTETRAFKYAYNSLDVVGKLNVKVSTNSKKSLVILKGDVRDIAHVRTHLKGGKLIINADSGYPRYALSVECRSRYLNAFNYSGQGEIVGKPVNSGLLDLSIRNGGTTLFSGAINLRSIIVSGAGNTKITGINSPDLTVFIHDSHHVQLIGKATVKQLNLQGKGHLDLYWLKSDELTVRAKDDTQIQLGGIANRVDVELWGHAQFNGRYLRAKRVFVKTHNHSIARVVALDRQHALALDASDVFFYNIPQMKAGFMGDAGAILDMRAWNRFAMKDYTHYNK